MLPSVSPAFPPTIVEWVPRNGQFDRSNRRGVGAGGTIESLLLALSDLKIISEQDISGVLDDAAAAHRSAGGSTEDAALHLAVVAILDRIGAGGNSVPRL